MSSRSIGRATSVVVLFTVLSAILGFGRESYIAYSFGSTGVTDAFYVAAIVPEMVASWISYALTNSLIPTLKAEIKNSLESASSLAGAVLWDAVALLAILLCFTLVSEKWIVRILAPGFSSSVHAEATHLLTIMALAILFSGLSGVLMGIHNAHESFSFPSMIGVTNNLLLLLATLAFKPWLGINALAIGVLAGAFGRLLLQLIPLVKHKYIRAHVHFWHPGIREILKVILPIYISVGLGTLNLIVDRILASGLPSGRISDLNFGNKIGTLPNGIIGVSLATTLYTRFVSAHQEGDSSRLRSLLTDGISLMLFVGVCTGATFALYSSDMVYIVFRHGAFNMFDLAVTSRPIIIYGCFQSFYLMAPIMTHFFYSRKRNAIVWRSSALLVTVNVVGSIILVRRYGIDGLVFSNSLSQAAYVIYLLAYAARDLKLSLYSFVTTIVRTAAPHALVFLSFEVLVFWLIPLKYTLFHCMFRIATSVLTGAIFVFIYTLLSKKNRISYLLLRYAKTIRVSRKISVGS